MQKLESSALETSVKYFQTIHVPLPTFSERALLHVKPFDYEWQRFSKIQGRFRHRSDTIVYVRTRKS